jgi:N-acetylglucosamine kinase-like BadF-type ATPase
VVFAEAGGDAVAAEILDRLAAEVVAFAGAALRRLELTEQPVVVLLGGGLMRAAPPRLRTAIEDGLQTGRQAVVCRVVADPPIVGAALLGLDEAAAGPAAAGRVRQELRDAVDALSEPATMGARADG